MPTPIELTLHTLLPTTHLLPPQLTELSTSLLAQSRAKASTLKQEEEIARIYACCHIACQRLGHKLALEIAKPAPPCKPRVYNKLHTYFNSVLATPRTPSKTAAKRDLDVGNPGRSATRSEKTHVTPVKTVGTPVTSTGKRKVGQIARAELPNYVMPMIRQLCKEFDIPEAAPHCLAGVQSVWHVEADGATAPKRRKIANAQETAGELSGNNELLLATIVAIFLVVLNEMHSAERSDLEIEEHTTKAIDTVLQYCDDNTSNSSQQCTSEDLLTDVDNLLHNANWTPMEWYLNIPRQDLDALQTEVDAQLNLEVRPAKTPLRRKEKHASRDTEDEPGAAGLLPGLGTMFQPALDWLSEERRAEYVVWKQGIMSEIDSLEMKGATGVAVS